MQALECAVVAAAGVGSRLGLGMPKCMLEIRGRTLLSRLIAALEPLVPRVHVVVGYREELIIEHCKRLHPHVVLVRNPDYRTTQTADSYSLGARSVRGRCVFLDGDLIVEPRSLAGFTRQAARDEILIGTTEAKSENAVFVHADDRDGSYLVRSFSWDERGRWEWANIVAGPSDMMDHVGGFVFETLAKQLPAPGHVIESCEIDTARDLERAEAYARRLGI